MGINMDDCQSNDLIFNDKSQLSILDDFENYNY